MMKVSLLKDTSEGSVLHLQRPYEMRILKSRRSNLDDGLRDSVCEEYDGNDTAFHPWRSHGVCYFVRAD